jgi:uncharacterized protein YdeI (YjbR/CyaY-like superfamily)
MASNPKPRYFSSPESFRAWLEKNHAKATHLWVGFHKVHTKRPSITWPQSVDQALAFGWIDGLRKGLGEEAYMIRFSARREGSIWSNINTKRVGELEKLGLMAPAGLAAFAKRTARRAGVYSFENPHVVFDAATEKAFRSRRKAWTFFEAQPPGYKRLCAHWVMRAKREETRARRLAEVIACSARKERVPLFTK